MIYEEGMMSPHEQDSRPEREVTVSRLASLAKAAKTEDLSWPKATSMVFLEEGRSLLREASRAYHFPAAANLDPNKVLEQLPALPKEKLLRGIGFVLAGSIGMAIEEAKKKDWTDSMFAAIYNQHALRSMLFPDIDRATEAYDEEETVRIRAIGQQDDGTLSLFFANESNLPPIVRWHLGRFPDEVKSYGFPEAVGLYTDTNKRLLEGEIYSREVSESPLRQETIEPSPVERFMEEVRRQAFLAEMDDLELDHDERARKLLEGIDLDLGDS